MDIKFIKISGKGDREIVSEIAEKKFDCNPVYLTGGVWIATKPLSIEGIPVKLNHNIACKILEAIGGVFPEYDMLNVIKKELTKKDFFDNNDSEEIFFKDFFVRLSSGQLSIAKGTIIEAEETEPAYSNGSTAYVYPMFWQKPSDAFYSEKEVCLE